MTYTPPLHVRLRPVLAFAVLALLVVAIEHAVVRLPAFARQPALSWGVLADVLVGLPLLFYGLLMRRYRLSPLVLGTVVGACLALAWWLLPVPAAVTAAFSSHRESGFVALMVMSCFGLLIESAALHLLVRLWSPAAAGWLLIVDAYTLLLFVAHGHAVRLQPTLLTADELQVRVGFFWQLTVSRAALQTAEALRDDFAAGPDTLNLARPLLTAPNVMLTFAAPVIVTGPYGIRRSARRLALYLDQPQAFLAAACHPSCFPTR